MSESAEKAEHVEPLPFSLLSEDQAARTALAMGLLAAEYAALRSALARPPSYAELAVFCGMWSEHCSYKSTRHLLATLPKDGPRVLAGPGSHAGVVDVGEGWAVAFKIESHNHPSAVEPYQGAATGVGGILRDVIAQGARPCAIMDFLCFGERTSRDTRRIERGVVSGIAGYGNAIGIANVGGRTHYDPGYEGNPLVNALAAGLVRPAEQRTARAAGVGNVLLLVGAPTGRDGILGAAFASESLGNTEQNSHRRSHIQIGDPFAGKLLLESVLAFTPEQGLVAVQDLGACGLACAVFEMAALGGVGIEVTLDAVQLREADMSALEIFLSESQERFALIVRADHKDAAIRHFQSYGVGAAAVGTLTPGDRVRVYHQGRCCVALPAPLVAGGAPASRWPIAETLPPPLPIPATATVADEPIMDMLLTLLRQTPDPESIYSHFDQTVGNRTIRGPGQAAAAVMRLPASQRGFALTLTGRGSLCAADPYGGAQAALSEALRRLACVGAELIAITDGLNFASPRDPLAHRRIAEVIRGLGDGLRTLGVPVTGGNVSLYNESPRGAIPPTPMIGALGLVADIAKVPTNRFSAGQKLVLLGTLCDSPGASLYLHGRCGAPVGAVSTDLEAEKRLAALLCAAVAEGLVGAAIAVAAGGLLPALATACVRSAVGAAVALPPSSRPHLQLFGEHPAQVLAGVASAAAQRLYQLAETHGVPVHLMGETGGTMLEVQGCGAVALATLAAAHADQPAMGWSHAA